MGASTFQFYCIFCGQQIAADTIVAGTEVVCPQCQGIFFAPKPPRKRRRRSITSSDDEPALTPDATPEFSPREHGYASSTDRENHAHSTPAQTPRHVLPLAESGPAHRPHSLLARWGLVGLPFTFWGLAVVLALVVTAAVSHTLLYEGRARPAETPEITEFEPKDLLNHRIPGDITDEELRVFMSEVREFLAEHDPESGGGSEDLANAYLLLPKRQTP